MSGGFAPSFKIHCGDCEYKSSDLLAPESLAKKFKPAPEVVIPVTNVLLTDEVFVAPLRVHLRFEPPVLHARGHHRTDVVAVLKLPRGFDARDVDIGTVHLNGVVPVRERLRARGKVLKLSFDRSAVLAALGPGRKVEVRVSGELKGLPFEAKAKVKVKR